MPHCMFSFLTYTVLQQIQYCWHFLKTPLLPPVSCRDKIERATLTGKNRQVILRGVQYPYAMTVFQQDIFWTDWTERGVLRAGKDDGSGFAVLAQDLQYRPNDIHVFAASKQQSCSSSCQQFNGGCSNVCVPGKCRLFLVGATTQGTESSLILPSSCTAANRIRQWFYRRPCLKNLKLWIELWTALIFVHLIHHFWCHNNIKYS